MMHLAGLSNVIGSTTVRAASFGVRTRETVNRVACSQVKSRQKVIEEYGFLLTCFFVLAQARAVPTQSTERTCLLKAMCFTNTS